MIDVHPAPVPQLSDWWIDSRHAALVKALARRRRRPARWATVAGASGAAASVSMIVLLGGSPQSAFAGWSAIPTPPVGAQLTSAVDECQTGMAQIPTNLSKGGDLSSLAPEVTDVRGPFTVTVFGDHAQHEVVCVASSQSASLRVIAPSGAPVSPGSITIDHVSYLSREGQDYTLVVGRTGAGVTGVTLSLADGNQVTATDGEGIVVAWWPGSQGVASAAVATASGVTTHELDLTGPSPSPSPGTKPAPPPGSRPSSGSSDQSTVCLVHSCGGAGV